MKTSSLATFLLFILNFDILQVSCQLQTSDYSYELFQIFEEALVRNKSNIVALRKFYYPPGSPAFANTYISVSISVINISNSLTWNGYSAPKFGYNGAEYVLTEAVNFSVTDFHSNNGLQLQDYILTTGLVGQLALVEYTSFCMFGIFTYIPVDLVGDTSSEYFGRYYKVYIQLSIDTPDDMPSYYDLTQALSLLISWVRLLYYIHRTIWQMLVYFDQAASNPLPYTKT